MTDIEELLSRYIQNVDRVFAEMKLSQQTICFNTEKAMEIVEMAKSYLEDAKFFRDRKRFETGLVSISYSEGLLDGLRLLKIVNFQWKQKNEKA
jgi:hypothetical protein